MAYTQSNEIKTRIALKYDSYANWKENNPTLLKGELAIAYLGSAHTTTSPDNGTHPILFKVGPGAFNSLPWASALAADVHAWAKAENVTIDGTSGALKFGEALSVNLASFYASKADLENLRGDLEADTDTQYTFTVDSANGDLTIQPKRKDGTSAGSAIVVPILTPGEVTELFNTLIADYHTKAEIKTLMDGLEGDIAEVSGKIDTEIGKLYTNAQIDDLLNAKQNASTLDTDVAEKGFIKSNALTPYAKVEDVNNTIDNKLAPINESINGINANFADYYNKTETKQEINAALESYYDKDEVDDLFSDLAKVMNFVGVVTSLPETANKGDVVVLTETVEDETRTREYVWDGNEWILLGDESRVGQIESGLSAVTTRVTTAEGKIAELEGTTGQHTTKLGELEQLITNNETDIEKKVSDLSGTVSTQGESITTNAQNIKKNSDDIAALPASITVSSDGSTGDYVSNITGNGKDGFKFTKTAFSVSATVTDDTAATSTEEEVAVVSAVENNGTTGHEVKLKATKTAVVTKAGATSIAQAKANDAVTNFVAGVTVDPNTTGAAIVDVVKGDNNSVTFKRGNINISTVEQTANTYVLFNCGSATEVI